MPLDPGHWYTHAFTLPDGDRPQNVRIRFGVFKAGRKTTHDRAAGSGEGQSRDWRV